MFELSAGAFAGLAESARARGGHETQEPRAKLVSRREHAGQLLGTGTCLSSHGAHLDELRVARGAPVGACGRLGESLAAPRTKSRRAKGRLETAGPCYCVTG